MFLVEGEGGGTGGVDWVKCAPLVGDKLHEQPHLSFSTSGRKGKVAT